MASISSTLTHAVNGSASANASTVGAGPAALAIAATGSRAFLLAHLRRTRALYASRCSDQGGGFYRWHRADGSVYLPASRDVISTAHIVTIFAQAYRQFALPADLARVQAGTALLRDWHRDGAADDLFSLGTALLAYAHAFQAGVAPARAAIASTVAAMTRHCWDARRGRYADQASTQWDVQWDGQRSDSANLLACDALIAAFDATGEPAHVRRAAALARTITDDPVAMQPGHLAKWAVQLLILERHPVALDGDTGWLLPRAQALFNAAVRDGWHLPHGGLASAVDLQGAPCDDARYCWVHAVALTAATLLAERTDQQGYREWYGRLWRYSWEHFFDHDDKLWFPLPGDEGTLAGTSDCPAVLAWFGLLQALQE